MTNPSPKKDGHLRRHFLMGLAVGAPVALTLWLVWAAIEMIDGKVMPLIPKSLVPAENILRMVPGAGVLIFFVAAVILGIMTRGFVGRLFVRLSDRFFDRLPVVRSIYSSVKQITDTVFGQDSPKFEKACLVEYPRPGSWAIAFISTEAKGEIAAQIGDNEPLLSLFVPTTPNPTSGFLLFVKPEDVVILDMGIDDAVKLVISAGLVYPNPKGPSAPALGANDPQLK